MKYVQTKEKLHMDIYGNIKIERMINIANGIPKKDGSGGGNRNNQGRGGCGTTQKTGKGKT
jgi:hypothetical protein